MSKTILPKLRPPLKTHGGKAYLARRIVALMPPHRVYVEPFLGGGSVLLNKPKAEREVAGDINGNLINFWEVLKERADSLTPWLMGTPYCLQSFQEALVHAGAMNDTMAAYGFLVRNRMSRGGLGKAFAWSERLRGGQPGDTNAWDTIRAELPAIAERIRDVEFNCCDAVQLIQSNDQRDALVYCDPPYLHSTRTARHAYAHEMSGDQHAELLATLLDCKGAVLLSGYRSEMYDRILRDWHRTEWDLPNHSGQGRQKQRRVECVWRNPRAMELKGDV